MSAAPFVLALGPTRPDQAFADLAGLAAAIVSARCAIAGRPDLRAAFAILAREAEPSGACLSLYAVHEGQGESLIGFAFLPDCAPGQNAPRRLMDAIVEAQEAYDRRIAA